MALTAAQAIDLLRSNSEAYLTLDALRSLAAKVDLSESGTTAVLHGGNIPEEIPSAKAVRAMLARGEDIRIVDTTETAKLLQSRDFLAATARAFGVSFDVLFKPMRRKR